MKRILLLSVLYLLGLSLGFGLTHAGAATLADARCTATGAAGDSDSYSDTFCTMSAEVTKDTLMDGGRPICVPVVPCDIHYKLNASWTSYGLCVDKIILKKGTITMDSRDVPWAAEGIVDGDVDCSVDCPTIDAEWHLYFMLGPTEQMHLKWKVSCITCPVGPQ